MCGICGIVNAQDHHVHANTLGTMCASIGHRGIVVPEDVGLGSNQLKIIDLENGH